MRYAKRTRALFHRLAKWWNRGEKEEIEKKLGMLDEMLDDELRQYIWERLNPDLFQPIRPDWNPMEYDPVISAVLDIYADFPIQEDE